MKSSIKKVYKTEGNGIEMTGLELTIGLTVAVVFFLWLSSLFKSKGGPAKYINSRGYVVLSDVNELEHRYIAKQKLGRDLAPNEMVHHINGNKTDNRISNLCLMDREKHEHFHSWLRWKKEKSRKYPSINDQKRILEEEYDGTLLEKLKSPTHTERLSAQLYLLNAKMPCWKCKQKNTVVALGVEPHKVSLDNDLCFQVLSNVTRVPEDIYGYLCEFNPRYRVTLSKEAQRSYLMNHCEKCDAPFGDAYLHKGPPFSPTTEEDAQAVQLVKLDLRLFYSVQTSKNGKSQRRFDDLECAYHPNELIWRYSARYPGSPGNAGWRQHFQIRSKK